MAMKRFVLVVFIGFTWGALAQIGIHSHNDYAQPKSLFGALEANASSIEVDVILKDPILYAAHEFESMESGLDYINTDQPLRVREYLDGAN